MPDLGSNDEEDADPLPWEPVGHGAIATGSVTTNANFWRAFVRNPVAMTWIEEGYILLWIVVAPESKEMKNAPSTTEHSAFVSGAVAEMLGRRREQGAHHGVAHRSS